jgi:hypothetical protein
MRRGVLIKDRIFGKVYFIDATLLKLCHRRTAFVFAPCGHKTLSKEPSRQKSNADIWNEIETLSTGFVNDRAKFEIESFLRTTLQPLIPYSQMKAWHKEYRAVTLKLSPFFDAPAPRKCRACV